MSALLNTDWSNDWQTYNGFPFDNYILNIALVTHSLSQIRFAIYSLTLNNSFFCSFDIVNLYKRSTRWNNRHLIFYIAATSRIRLFETDTLLPSVCNSVSITPRTKELTESVCGAPFRAALANIFVRFWEGRLFEITSMPIFYKRYVDDTFVTFSVSSESRRFFHAIEQQHPALIFTYEFEHYSKPLFLEVGILEV